MVRLSASNQNLKSAGLDGVLAVNEAEAARMIGVAQGTLRNWRCRRGGKGAKGPRWARLEGGRIVYPVSELKRFLRDSIVA